MTLDPPFIPIYGLCDIMQKIEWNNEVIYELLSTTLPHSKRLLVIHDICSVLAGLETKVISGGMNYNMYTGHISLQKLDTCKEKKNLNATINLCTSSHIKMVVKNN